MVASKPDLGTILFQLLVIAKWVERVIENPVTLAEVKTAELCDGVFHALCMLSVHSA